MASNVTNINTEKAQSPEASVTEDMKKLEKDSQSTPKPRTKLSGSKRKRVKRYIQVEGLSYSEALQKALLPANSKHGGKRNLSNRSENGQDPKKVKQTTEEGQTIGLKRPRLHRSNPSEVKVAVVPRNFPYRRLSAEEIASIRSKVLYCIGEQKSAVIKPKFTRQYTIRAGWLIFYCADHETAAWLREIRIWPDFDCTTRDEANFPKQPTVTGYFEASADLKTETILAIIQGQNTNLLATAWHEVRRSSIKSCAVLTLEIDPTSLDQLKSMNFVIDYGFGQKIKLKPKTSNGPSEDHAAAGTAVTPADFTFPASYNGNGPTEDQAAGVTAVTPADNGPKINTPVFTFPASHNLSINDNGRRVIPPLKLRPTSTSEAMDEDPFSIEKFNRSLSTSGSLITKPHLE